MSIRTIANISKAWHYLFDSRRQLLPHWAVKLATANPLKHWLQNLGQSNWPKNWVNTTNVSLIIHSDQTGFIKGRCRFLGQNVQLLNDTMECTEAEKLPGILLFIDFGKVFNTIEWNFIHSCIELYKYYTL